MKLLLIHADYLEYELKDKATSEAEEFEDKGGRIDDGLVVFTSVEKFDGDEEVAGAVEEIDKVGTTLGIDRVLVYPYAHLSSELASPKDAKSALDGIIHGLEQLEKYQVSGSPFGWYKGFELKCKGHPLSELSKVVRLGKKWGRLDPKKEKKEEVSTAVLAEDTLRSEWFVMGLDGTLHPADEFDFSDHPSLKTFYEYETKGTRIYEKDPAHIKMMRGMSLVDYEPGSDSGNFRWYPKGWLIKKLLESHITNMVIEYGAMAVETPIMYDFEHPHLKKYMDRFPARQYIVKSEDKEFFLRFSACFGQYLMKHDMSISYRHLPLKMYELTHYSFRREQRGELSGLRRLRTFTMPDLHTLCADLESAKEEFKSQNVLAMKWMDSLQVDYDVGLRFVKDFFYENQEIVKELLEVVKKPILIELWEERFFYFVMKSEFSVSDTMGKAATLSTVQIDVENPERFEITYTGKDGSDSYPLMLHASISGAIDRCLYALLENEAKQMEKGKKPILPLWLSPTQVRVCVVADRFIPYAEEIVLGLIEKGIRADLDDIDRSVGKKVREAEKEWVPYIVVIGEEEVSSGSLAVRMRKEKTQKNMSVSELEELVRIQVKGFPNERLPLSIKLSKRPQFV